MCDRGTEVKSGATETLDKGYVNSTLPTRDDKVPQQVCLLDLISGKFLHIRNLEIKSGLSDFDMKNKDKKHVCCYRCVLIEFLFFGT